MGDPGKWSHYDLIFAVCLEDQNFSKNENPQKEATQPPTQRLPVNDRAEDRSVGHMPQEEPATKRIWDTVTIRSRSFHLRSEIGKEETHSQIQIRVSLHKLRRGRHRGQLSWCRTESLAFHSHASAQWIFSDTQGQKRPRSSLNDFSQSNNLQQHPCSQVPSANGEITSGMTFWRDKTCYHRERW